MRFAPLVVAMILAGCSAPVEPEPAPPPPPAPVVEALPTEVAFHGCYVQVGNFPAQPEDAPLPEGFEHRPYPLAGAGGATGLLVTEFCESATSDGFGDVAQTGPLEQSYRGFLVVAPAGLTGGGVDLLVTHTAADPLLAELYRVWGVGDEGTVQTGLLVGDYGNGAATGRVEDEAGVRTIRTVTDPSQAREAFDEVARRFTLRPDGSLAATDVVLLGAGELSRGSATYTAESGENPYPVPSLGGLGAQIVFDAAAYALRPVPTNVTGSDPEAVTLTSR